MDPEVDLFVQAFWVKCREVIRPEIDQAAARFESAGHRVGVSSQEYDAAGTASGPESGSGPSLTLTVDGSPGAPNGDAHVPATAPGSALHFTGDVVRQNIVVTSSGTKPTGTREVFELAHIDAPTVKAIVDGWI